MTALSVYLAVFSLVEWPQVPSPQVVGFKSAKLACEAKRPADFKSIGSMERQVFRVNAINDSGILKIMVEPVDCSKVPPKDEAIINVASDEAGAEVVR